MDTGADTLEAIRQLLSNPLVSKLATVVIGAFVVLLLGRLAKRALSRYVHDDNARYRARKIVTFGAWLVVVLFVAGVFSNQLGSLTVAFGLTGAGIAFALQEVIVSLAAWVSLSFGGIYKIGDRVNLGGVRGDVIDISPTRTTLMECGEWVDGDLYNGRVVRVSNSFIFKSPLYNYSGDFPFLWDELRIPIRHDSDLLAARKLLEQSASAIVGDYVGGASQTMDRLVEKYYIERAVVEPMITMVADENWATFTVRYVVDYKKRRTTKDRLFADILHRIGETGGKVAVATTSQEITVTPNSEVSVTLESSAP